MQAGLVLGGTIDEVRTGAARQGGAGTSRTSERLYTAARVVGWADEVRRAARNKDYANAAAAGLGLAAELSGRDDVARAARVGEAAAGVIGALKSRNVGVIAQAGLSLYEQVNAERAQARAEQRRLAPPTTRTEVAAATIERLAAESTLR